MALTLRDLADERLALDALIAQDDGEYTPEAEALERDLVAQLMQKVDSFGTFLAEQKATAEALDEELVRLSTRQRAITSRIERLKRYAQDALQSMGRDRVEGLLYTFALQKNPASVLVDVLPDALPAEFVRVQPEVRTADRKAIAAALKAGHSIDGCQWAPTTYHLRIR